MMEIFSHVYPVMVCFYTAAVQGPEELKCFVLFCLTEICL